MNFNKFYITQHTISIDQVLLICLVFFQNLFKVFNNLKKKKRYRQIG